MKKYHFTATYITALEYVELGEEFNEGQEIFAGIKIINNGKIAKKFFSQEFFLSIGMLEADSIFNSKAILYRKQDVDDSFLQPEKSQNGVLTFLRYAQSICSFTWLIKDHSIDFNMGFVQISANGRFASCSSRSIAAKAGTHSCESTTIKLSAYEVRQIRKRLSFVNNTDIDSLVEWKPYQINRLERAFYFLQEARHSIDVGVRIAFYCTCFESLFSTDSSELTHKLSERIAFFIGETPQDKLDTYNIVKRSYSIRSTVIHGDKLSGKKQESLVQVSLDCDILLRKILNKIISSSEIQKLFESDNEKLELFFAKLIFGLDKS